jgi:hypothetical protein
MANSHGGYRQPSHPAPVSGPGAHSARTDRGVKQYDVTGGSYGSSQDFQQQQSAAPLAPKPGAPGSVPQGGMDLSSIIGLDAPSTQPNIPVTDGAAAGPGAGPAALGQPIDPKSQEAQALARYVQVMIRQSDADGATPAFKAYVHQLIQNLP